MEMLIEHLIIQLGLRNLPSAIYGILRKCSGVSAVFGLLICEQPIRNELTLALVQSGLRDLPPGVRWVCPDSVTLGYTLSIRTSLSFQVYLEFTQ